MFDDDGPAVDLTGDDAASPSDDQPMFLPGGLVKLRYQEESLYNTSFHNPVSEVC